MKAIAIVCLVAWAGLTGTALHIAATPCPTEDSVMCFWNGDTRGNKTGYNYVALSETLTIRTK